MGKRLQVMKLEIAGFTAALAAFIDIPATSAISPVHLVSFRRGDVSTAPARRLGVGERVGVRVRGGARVRVRSEAEAEAEVGRGLGVTATPRNLPT